MTRFIANETFTSEENGMEYAQGAIYDVDPSNSPYLDKWKADGKVRDPDAKEESEYDEAAAKDDDDGPEEDEDDDDKDDEDEPA